MPPIWLDGRELAERIDERYETVMEWARTDRIPSIHTGRRVMFNLDRVLDSLRCRTGAAGWSDEEVGITRKK